jgi:hypothetical protein
MLTKEGTFETKGASILFLVGYGVIDSSCCGVGGCRYGLVPGYVIAWKYARDDRGRPVSLVVPITDPKIREDVHSFLSKTEGVSQVSFDIARH